MGENQVKILKRASCYILHPKPIIQKKECNNNDEWCNRIGNFSFPQPSAKVWANAILMALDLAVIISHITPEQQMSYILQKNCPRILTVVQNCGLRQEFISSAISVANIIKHSTLDEPKLVTE